MKDFLILILLASLLVAACEKKETVSVTPALSTAKAPATPAATPPPPVVQRPPAMAGMGPLPLPAGTVLKTDPNGVEWATIRPGGGTTPTKGQTVEVHYTLWLKSTSERIDSSEDRGQPARLVMGDGTIVPGLEAGILDMKLGERRRLVVPESLGPGKGGSAPNALVPPGEFVIYDVELLSVH